MSRAFTESHATAPGHGLRVALGLALAPLVALGFSRFAYALLLPAMRQEFAWTYVQAGALNTANAIGYIVGALLASTLAARWGPVRAFTTAMALSALALILTALPSSFAVFLAIRALGGASTAIAFVLGAALVSHAMPGRPATALAIYFAGSGLGIVLAGLLAPLLAGATGDVDWRQGWLAMGAASLLGTALAHRVATAPATTGQAGLAASLGPTWRGLGPSLVANMLFGAGYVGYMTYMVAFLDMQGFTLAVKAAFFGILGGASIVVSPLWGHLLSRLPVGRGFAWVAAAVALGSLPALVWPSVAAIVASALLFGSSFMAGPAAVSVVAQRVLPAAHLTFGLALLTASFSVGQSLGPVIAGWLSDATGSLSAGLWLGPVLLLVGATVSLRQR
ncbi:MAG: YbfB/YjiJ family MFS transporter [Burkholderiaceae bacterium]